MKKEEFKKEIAELLEASIALEEASALELKTAKFLAAEGERLMSVVENENTPFDEKETAIKCLESLLGKMEYESRMLKKYDDYQKIQDRLKVLNMLCQQGMIEEE